jgi:hypothetical protein
MVEINRTTKKSYHYRTMVLAKPKQRGVVLVVSLVFLVALTAAASALMLNTTTDIKMSGASEEKVVATQEAFGAVDEIIFLQVKPEVVNGNKFAYPIAKFRGEGGISTPLDVSDDLNSNNKSHITKAEIGIGNNQFFLESDCPHSKLASSTEVFTCNVLKIELTKKYGRKKTSAINVHSGVTQQLLR